MMNIKFFLLILSAVSIIVGAVEAKTISVCGAGCDFSSISDAVKSVKDGDIINVKEGVYTDYIIINKSIAIIGEGKVDIYPIPKSSIVFGISGDNITLKNINIHGKREALCIDILAASKIYIENTNLYECLSGIDIFSSREIYISNFRIESSSYGIEAYSSSKVNAISGSILNSEFGIGFNSTSYSEVSNVAMSNVDVGIYLVGSDENTLKDLRLYGSGSDISFGIKVHSSKNNKIKNSLIENFGFGIDLEFSSSNEISYNTIKSCNIGISATNSRNDVIYQNMLNNRKNAYTEKSVEIWNRTIGNLWSDFDEPSEGCIDGNSDGICDSPYSIDKNNIDYMPISKKTEEEKGGIPAGGAGGTTESKKQKKYTILSKDFLQEVLKNFGIKDFYDTNPPLFAALAPLSEKIGLYPAPFKEGIEIKTVNGRNVYKVIEEHVLGEYSYANEVVLVRSDIEADAFSAIAYAKIKNAPILLTDTKNVPEEIKNVIKKLKPKKITIIGGPEAVSIDVEMELSKYAEVNRLWGETRIETSIEVAKFLGTVNVVITQNGWNISKSTAIVSCLYNAPIIYVKDDIISNDVKEYLIKLKGKDVVFIFSGVDETVINEVKRIVE